MAYDLKPVRAMIDRLNAEALKRGQVAAIKSRTMGLHGKDLRDALKTVGYYERALNAAVLDFYRGEIDAGEFIDEQVRLIEQQFERAWNEGSRSVEVDPKDHKPEDDAELQRLIDAELEYVLGYAEAIEQAQINGDPVKPLQDRVALWANKYNEIVNAARIWFGYKVRLKWIYGDTIEHCATCEALNGIVATPEDWDASGWRPQASNLDCGGWRCQCQLVPTKEPATPGGIPVG